jgi:hypothetical protein
VARVLNGASRAACKLRLASFFYKPEYEQSENRRLQYGLMASVVTPKPANGGQGKTGQREEAGDSVVFIPRRCKKRKTIMNRKKVDNTYILQWFR